MKITQRVKKILANYESDNPGTKANIARILMTGKLAGTGKMVILPVDQGFEHGPARSFAKNAPAYDPHYHYQLAIDAGLNAYAAPLGMLEAGADSYAGAIPTIIKLNSSNSHSTNKDQAVYGSVADALRLGCAAIGFTIYPGSEDQFEMMEEFRELAEEAKAVGLAVVLCATNLEPKPLGILRERHKQRSIVGRRLIARARRRSFLRRLLRLNLGVRRRKRIILLQTERQ